MNFLSTLGYGGIVAVIGMLIVFTGLIILIGFIWLMGKVFQAFTGKKAEKPAKPAPAPAPAPVAAAPAVEEAEVVDDAQLIAVIAAAIAAYDNSGKTLVVRKVRRIAGWNSAARHEQVYKF